MIFRTGAAIICILLAIPVCAQAEDTDAAQPKPIPVVTLPETVDGLAKTIAKGSIETFDLMTNYQKGQDIVSIYVFRATNPNAALWFDRADQVLNYIWTGKGLGNGSEIEKFNIPGTSENVGLMRSYPLSGNIKSTALAVAEINGWIIKVRSTSTVLSSQNQKNRLENVFSSIKLPATIHKSHPIIFPPECPEINKRDKLSTLVNSEVIHQPTTQAIMTAGLVALANARALTGETSGLAASPELYCRAKLNGPSFMGTLYRRTDGADKSWVILFADSGRSISGIELPELGKDSGGAVAAVTADDLNRTSVVMFLKGMADPDVVFMPLAQYLAQGGGDGYTSVTYRTNQINVSLPEKDKQSGQ